MEQFFEFGPRPSDIPYIDRFEDRLVDQIVNSRPSWLTPDYVPRLPNDPLPPDWRSRWTDELIRQGQPTKDQEA